MDNNIKGEAANKRFLLIMPYYIKRKKVIGENKKKSTGVKRKPNLIKKLDRVFSLYIRLRDAMPSGYVKCISCGKIKRFDDVDCGHFHSRVHMATRFDEFNCHAECKFCNRFSSDHLISYQRNLIRKIGQNMFDILNAKAHSTKQWSDWELEQMITFYTKKVKELSLQKGIKVNL